LNEIGKIKPYDTNLKKFTFNTIHQPYPTFLNEIFPEFTQFLLQKSSRLNTTDKMQQGSVGKGNKTRYFLIQVGRIGSKSLIENHKYRHLDWQLTPKDSDHGKVMVDDYLLVYFARSAIKYQMNLKKIYKVTNVSSDNTLFDVKESRNLNGISLNDIKNAIDNKKLNKEIFVKLAQQGFNIKRIEKDDFDQIINLDNDLFLQRYNKCKESFLMKKTKYS
jgi:hypothetical protein